MCTFTIDFQGDAEQVFTEIERQVLSESGHITGNSREGSFEINTLIGNFKGTYSITLQQIEIIIAHRPFLISCNRIEGEVQGRLQGF